MFDISRITTDALVVAATGYFIVFTALVLLYLVFNNLPRVLKLITSPTLRRVDKKQGTVPEREPVVGEVNAAIAMAIYLHLEEMHDEESTNLTINKVSRNYSPWSSKIYGLNQTGNLRKVQ